MELATGQRLAVLDAFGQLRRKRVIRPANSGGHTFVACNEEEWEAAERDGRDPEPDPFAWPIEDVQP